MSRASRVPYHQNVYDLLQIEPGESPEAARMIVEHEAKHGPLPASVREWYLVRNMVPLSDSEEESIWADYIHRPRSQFYPLSLAVVLTGFAHPHGRHPWLYVRIVSEGQQSTEFWIQVDGSEDPSVWNDEGRTSIDEWVLEADPFSEFVADWICSKYPAPTSNPGAAPPLYTNGLWLRTPDEPFQPPVIDFLTDHFGEPERTPRPGSVTTYTYRPEGGTIRVTADEPALTGALSAWWIHAETRERLAEFAELLRPWGTLRDTLRADTDPAREVLNRLKGERPV